MEKIDLELIERIADDNDELRGLWQEHMEFERRLDAIHRKGHLTLGEELEEKDIKKRKLQGRDRIEQILSAYR